MSPLSAESVRIQAKMALLETRMAAACARSGRSESEVTLMAVTKTHPVGTVEAAERLGLRLYGENRVQEAAAKRSEVTTDGRWELIGPLQSNKAKLALETFDRIQTIDRPKLVQLLDRLVGEGVARGSSPYPILLQVNAGDDPAKSGTTVEGAEALLECALAAKYLRVEGLMTIAPLSEDPAVAERCFFRLRALRDRLEGSHGVALPVLSMGMTDDLEAAIAAGSTLIRVGSALFGQR